MSVDMTTGLLGNPLERVKSDAGLPSRPKFANLAAGDSQIWCRARVPSMAGCRKLRVQRAETRHVSRNPAQAAVVGIGHSPVYRRAEQPLGVLAVQAAQAAIADAGLIASDIDGITTSPVHPAAAAGSIEGIQTVGTHFMIKALRLDPSYSDQGTFMISQAFIQAVNAVAAGACQYALVFRALHNPAGRYGRIASSQAYGADQWYFPYGSTGPSTVGQQLRRYMHKNGGTKEQLGTFVVRSRDQGLMNENSYWAQHRPERITLAEYLAVRPVSEPIGMYDCDIPIQGAAALVLTSVERARDLIPRPGICSRNRCVP